nr:PREDICTED: extracellular calcium-sensing receptor-like [Latimeria chalumnae]|eukprot:XP_014345827.1 PREDICTED: extracellular calcium-sensing receptor-like [Latimeria chalumnae]
MGSEMVAEAMGEGAVNTKEVCKVQGKFNLPAILKEGDINIGGLFPIHNAMVQPDLTFKRNPHSQKGEGFNFRVFRWVQTMVFTIEQINRDPHLLPNITLGYRIYDSCSTPLQALRAAAIMVNGQEGNVTITGCTPSMPVVIGEARSTLSIAISRFLGLFSIPVISYFSTCVCLSDKQEFPTFLRTVPSDFFQVKALVQLVKHFGWTWIGSIASNDDYGQYGLQVFNEEVTKLGACIAFTEFIPKVNYQAKVTQIVETIKMSKAKVILLLSAEHEVSILMQEVMYQNVLDKQWIASEGWVTSALISTRENLKILSGTIGFAIQRAEIPQLKEFLHNIHPSQVNENPFVTEFWGTLFNCSTKIADEKTGARLAPCSGEEDLANSPNIYSDVTQLRVSYNVYKAVYAIAHSLHNMMICQHDRGPFINNTCPNISSIEPWQLLHYLKNVNFIDNFGEEINFDENGDPVPSYDLLNWQKGVDGSVSYVRVGQFNGKTELGPKLTIYEDKIVWNSVHSKVPESVCSESCPPGTRKAILPGKPHCCFDCVPCADGKISNQTDSIECMICPPDFWSNVQKDFCLPKEVEYLSFMDRMGIVLLTVALIGTGLTFAITAVFARYRNTPIVKANNSELSFLILFSLALCFLCSITFIGQPTMWSCKLRHVAFGIIFAFCISCILGKTIVVLMAFRANLPGNNVMRWFGPRQQRAIIIATTFIQIIISTVWMIIAPPLPVKNGKYLNSRIILECDVGSLVAFALVLSYIGLLSCICFVLAFLARNLPDSFNEAKYITFSMLIFFAVWISFIPAYISTAGKYTIAVEIFAILSSNLGLLLCLFAPKCYIILLKPEKNSKKNLMNRFTNEKKY